MKFSITLLAVTPAGTVFLNSGFAVGFRVIKIIILDILIFLGLTTSAALPTITTLLLFSKVFVRYS
jgi:hypothetical protein